MFLFCATKNARSQDSARKYYFREIGWTMTLPPYFIIQDSTANRRRLGRAKELMEEATNFTTDTTGTITLLAAKKDNLNYFYAGITPFSSRKDGNWDSLISFSKGELYRAFVIKLPEAKIDSVGTTNLFGGLTFSKYKITITTENRTVINSVLVSKLYKGYTFAITYFYNNEATKNEIEKMLENSSFSK